MQFHCFFSMLLPDTLGGLVAGDEPGVLPKLIIKKNATRLGNCYCRLLAIERIDIVMYNNNYNYCCLVWSLKSFVIETIAAMIHLVLLIWWTDGRLRSFFLFLPVYWGCYRRASVQRRRPESRETRTAAREEKWNFLRLSEYKLAGNEIFLPHRSSGIFVGTGATTTTTISFICMTITRL